MNLDELQSVRDRERQTDKLQQLRESFYADAGSFIQQLRDERDRAAERADDPFDAPEVSQLSDEIDTAEQTVEAIYEKRVGKIVKAASFAAADLPAEVDGMTAEEQTLFENLVDEITGNREHVLAVLAGEDGPGAAIETPSPATDRDAAGTAPDRAADAGTADASASPADHDVGGVDADVSAADVMGGDAGGGDAGPDDTRERESSEGPGHQPPPPEHGEPAGEASAGAVGSGSSDPAAGSAGDDAPQPEPAATGDQPAGERPVRKDGGTGAAAAQAGTEASPAIERETVRVTEDVDTFVGSDDRDYDLGPNDVVTLPATNARLLVERDAAEQLD